PKINIDFWSDTDLILVLKEREAIRGELFEKVIAMMGEVIGQESFPSKDQLTQRFILYRNDSIERLDLTIVTYAYWPNLVLPYKSQFKVLYGKPLAIATRQEAEKFDLTKAAENHPSIDKIWFLLFECVKKWMRNDHLIGLHLLLEVLQAYLVLRMQARDVQYQRSIHREGYQEQLPEAITLQQLDYQDKKALLIYLENLSIAIDQGLQERYPNYKSRVAVYRRYLMKKTF
ncbi:MAG: hypothetical protein AAFP19_23875, partial [Bacteroidota bacterium]